MDRYPVARTGLAQGVPQRPHATPVEPDQMSRAGAERVVARGLTTPETRGALHSWPFESSQNVNPPSLT